MRVNLTLLAGRGKRFSDAGYTLPKPLIEVDGLPMVIAATNDLPPADKQIFVVSGDYVQNNAIDETLKKYYPQSQIVVQTVPLQGQAHSALQAESLIDPNDILTVSSCDVGLVYDKQKFEELLKDPKVDALVWSFRNYPHMELNPNAYGWIEIDKDNFVKRVTYKQPISDHPLRDHAVVAHFTYKKASFCFGSVKEMIEKNLKTGPEFSLDECSNVLVNNGLRVKVFEVDVFRCWGTPTELKTYQYWQEYFKNF